ncbi:MAG: hydrogenase maturation nickel metallochaperone HypA [Candidatus Bipolaricaulota bacterium]
MHEYSIARELVETLIDQVDEADLRRAEVVHVELGELRVLSKKALSSAYDITTQETVLEDSRIEFEDVELEVSCKECDFVGQVNHEEAEGLHFAIPVLSCPRCGGPVEVKKGNELAIRTLTIADDDED